MKKLESKLMLILAASKIGNRTTFEHTSSKRNVVNLRKKIAKIGAHPYIIR